VQLPAPLSVEQTAEIRRLAVEAFEALECEGLARVDFFLGEDGNFVVNEINTMPGFTTTSMYPQMWAASGVSYAELVDRLIAEALARPSGLR
jgi:D-alanine-D-alanine ligase